MAAFAGPACAGSLQRPADAVGSRGLEPADAVALGLRRQATPGMRGSRVDIGQPPRGNCAALESALPCAALV